MRQAGVRWQADLEAVPRTGSRFGDVPLLLPDGGRELITADGELLEMEFRRGSA